jgi:predicted phosphodiesterase
MPSNPARRYSQEEIDLVENFRSHKRAGTTFPVSPLTQPQVFNLPVEKVIKPMPGSLDDPGPAWNAKIHTHGFRFPDEQMPKIIPSPRKSTIRGEGASSIPIEAPAIGGRFKHQRYVVLTDLHVPFHRKQLFPKVLQAIKDVNPYGLILSGDFLDMASLSRHHADSLYFLRDFDLDDEYRWGNEVLEQIDSAATDAKKKAYIYGNHEDFYIRELQKGDHAKYGGQLTSPTDGLTLRERGYEVMENWKEDLVRIGQHLDVIHGVYTTKHPSPKHVEEFHGSVMFGHTHRASVYYDGERAGFNIGCLCDIHHRAFGYMPKVQRNKWSNGFGVVDVDDNGRFYAQVVQAWGDRFSLDGRLY